jgi:hypothetical protein
VCNLPVNDEHIKFQHLNNVLWDSQSLSQTATIGVLSNHRTLELSVDVVMLSRLQFALTIMFHYIFPPLTIGLGVVLVYLEGMYLGRSIRFTNRPRSFGRESEADN